jgi:NAD(P)-dependent dehydrogenase (short-subunit alcohol dehydrogenase family)
VNNAGVGPNDADRGSYPLAEWRRLVEINLMGVVHGVNAAYPRMRDRGSGTILNVASLAGLVAGPSLGPYAATKYAVVGLSLGLRADARPSGCASAPCAPASSTRPILDGDAPDGTPTLRTYIKQFGLGDPIPPAQIAQAALGALRRDRALIVAPRMARTAWWDAATGAGAAGASVRPRSSHSLADRSAATATWSPVSPVSPVSPRIVLVHGLGRDLHDWDAVAPDLEDLGACTAVDLAGFGAEPPPADGRSPRPPTPPG